MISPKAIENITNKTKRREKLRRVVVINDLL